MKIKCEKLIDDKCVITKAELIQMLKVRRLELDLFENAARIPKVPNRKGYTFQEYKLLLRKAERFYGTIGKGGPVTSYS